jgi:glutamate dehydrogenase
MLRLAGEAGVAPEQAARAWAEAGERFGLDALRAAAEAAPAPSPLAARARAESLAALALAQARLAQALLAGRTTEAAGVVALAREAAAEGGLVAVGVAVRALAALA